MPPLQRQDTHTSSLLSWWSDSNPLVHSGATINLHAATKPLMKWMYHQQALRLIAQNAEGPLSEDLLTTYSTYLSFVLLSMFDENSETSIPRYKYVSRATKRRVLDHLTQRARVIRRRGEEILNSPVLDQIPPLVESSDQLLRASACALAAEILASHSHFLKYFPHTTERTARSQLHCTVGQFILNLRSVGTEQHVFAEIAHALAVLLWQSERGADVLLNLLDSTTPSVRSWTCVLLEILAHEGEVAVMHSSLIGTVFKLLEDSETSASAASALIQLSEWPGHECAPPFIAALGALDTMLDVYRLRACACEVIANLAKNPHMYPSLVQHIHLVKLWKMLRDSDAKGVSTVTNALLRIASYPEGVEGLGNALQGLLNWRGDPFSITDLQSIIQLRVIPQHN